MLTTRINFFVRDPRKTTRERNARRVALDGFTLIYFMRSLLIKYKTRVVMNHVIISLFFNIGHGLIGRALASGGEPSFRLACSIPNRYPWVHCVCPIINKIRNCNCVPMVEVPPSDWSLGQRLFWASNLKNICYRKHKYWLYKESPAPL